MDESEEKNYQDIIDRLVQLRSISIAREFRSRVSTLFVPQLPLGKAYFFYPIKIALATVILMLAAGAGLVVAAESSKKGDLLYPIKQAEEKVGWRPNEETPIKVETQNKNVEEKVEEIPKTEVKGPTSELKKTELENESPGNVEKSLENESQITAEIKKTASTTGESVVDKATDSSENAKGEINSENKKSNTGNNSGNALGVGNSNGDIKVNLEDKLNKSGEKKD